MRRGLSVQSDGIALTMSWYLATGTFAICSNRIRNITTRLASTYADKDTPASRPVQAVGRIVANPHAKSSATFFKANRFPIVYF
jgi:hypothetical protein